MFSLFQMTKLGFDSLPWKFLKCQKNQLRLGEQILGFKKIVTQ